MGIFTTILAMFVVTVGYAGGWLLGLNSLIMIVITLIGITLGFKSMNEPGNSVGTFAVFLGSLELVVTVIIMFL